MAFGVRVQARGALQQESLVSYPTQVQEPKLREGHQPAGTLVKDPGTSDISAFWKKDTFFTNCATDLARQGHAMISLTFSITTAIGWEPCNDSLVHFHDRLITMIFKIQSCPFKNVNLTIIHCCVCICCVLVFMTSLSFQTLLFPLNSHICVGWGWPWGQGKLLSS